MLIYEVNLTVQEAAADAYLAALKDHILEILEFDGFQYASLLQDSDAGEGTRRYVVQYYVADQASLDDYLLNHSARMRNDMLDRFPDVFTATRRVLDIIGEFERP